MTRRIYDTILPDVDEAERARVQEDFGRHVVEHRNRMAALVRKWIVTDAKLPIPIYDRLLQRVRRLGPSLREDIVSTSLLMVKWLRSLSGGFVR